MLQEVLNETLSFIDWKYEVQSPIIESGQRVVFKGVEIEKNLRCIIKVSKYSDPVSISRYQREIKVLVSLNSEYFPKIFDHTFCSKEIVDDLKDSLLVEDKRTLRNFIEVHNIRSFYLNTEEYIEHLDWASYKNELLSNEDIFKQFFWECFTALNILWDRKIVHRDLKPDNILIRTSNKKPVIIDLGIAKSLNDNTQNLTIGPTPCTYQYGSPEQILNNAEQIDYKSDQFSMGVLMFFLLSGDFPYGNADDSDFFVNLKSGNHKSLDDYDVPFSQELKDFIHKLLEQQPHRRFRKTETILKTLRR